MLKKFGQDLQKIRESKMISIADISGRTKIHKTILEKMERGDFSFFSATHIRAFLKQYAKAIGVSSDDILFNYEMAKNGKYSSMIKDVEEKENKIKEEEAKISYVVDPELPKEVLDKKDKTASEGNINDIFEIPSSEIKSPHSDKKYEDENIYNNKEETLQRRPFSKSKRIKLESEKGEFSGKFKEEKGFHISAGVLKYAGVVLFILALLYGIYLLVDVVFLQKHYSNTEIVKQNFDDVVKETEKKVLGKRSEEEIKDSIEKAVMRADSIRKAENDSITFKIVGLNTGSLTLVADTLTEQNKYVESFEKGSTGVWKVREKIYLTSKNTEAFEVFVNGKKIKIADKKINKLKITKSGISK